MNQTPTLFFFLLNKYIFVSYFSKKKTSLGKTQNFIFYLHRATRLAVCFCDNSV